MQNEYKIGQKVILCDRELGTVVTPENTAFDLNDYVWVRSPSLGYASAYALHNVRPVTLESNARASGRTIRNLLKAITAASEGHHVIVTAFSHKYASSLQYQCLKVLEALLPPQGIVKKESSIHIVGGGVIQFATHDSRHHLDSRKIKWFPDHYVGE